MKKKLMRLLIFASAGAIFHTEPAAFAANAKTQLLTENKVGTELRANAPLDQVQLKKISELIGANVRNQQDEKIGNIKDLMVDLQSGRVPFAVVASGGFFGVGDQLLVVPTMTFAQMADRNELVLDMDKERLKSAPSFNKSHWPDMTDQLWNSQVYSFYGAQPYWKNSPAVSTTRATINEPADAEFSTRINTTEIYPEVYGESETDLSPSRHPRKGLGAEDLTQNEQRLNTPKGFAVSEVFVQEPSGAETKRPSVAPTTTIEESETLKTASPSEIGTAKIHKAKRASELIGMEVKNAQDERIGEIKDLVVDLKTGRVAYTVLEAGGLLEVDKLYAVPPSVFTRSSDERWLVFNTDKETLKSAPGFEKNNWPQAGDHKFTTEVYRFSHQRPYWQSSDEIREPAGSEPRTKRQESRDESQKPPTGGQSRRD